MNELLLRIFLIIPWAFIVWLISQSFSGSIDGFLTFILVLILIPVALVVNIGTAVYFKGRAALKQMRNMQSAGQSRSKVNNSKRAIATNYADLPWYDVRRWIHR